LLNAICSVSTNKEGEKLRYNDFTSYTLFLILPGMAAFVVALMPVVFLPFGLRS
jgi:hypothetical protein